MGEVLYRKYRPRSLDDVVGQPHITKTLSNALKDGRISHGYLFTGPRGVGKTSVARILAHQVNNFPYGDNMGALDIIEIDAASNRRIDEIRDLRDKVHIAPVAGKYKVYIIDEVHMLTREAFNALLKTLEEPPAHVIFILATTEAHKLPETIVSRTQRFTFKAVGEDEVVAHLAELAKKEHMKISSDALHLIAKHGEGSFRDSISILDQLRGKDKVDNEDVEQLLGLPSEKLIIDLITSAENQDLATLIKKLESAQGQGLNAIQIAAALSDAIRQSILNEDVTKVKLDFAQKLLNVGASANPPRYLEIILTDLALDHPVHKHTEQTTVKQAVQKPPRISKITEQPKAKTEIKDTDKQTNTQDIKPDANDTELQTMLANGMWNKLLEKLKKQYNTLYGLTRMADPQIEEDELVLYVPFAFHQKRLNEEKNAAIIRSTIVEITGRPIRIKTEVRAANPTEQQIVSNSPQPVDSDTLETVTQIFGGGEVLET